MRTIPAGLLILALAVGTAAAAPPPKKSATGPWAVDVVTLKSGRSLRGAIVQRNVDRSVTMVVSRAWLQTANPELFAQQEALDLQTQRDAWQQTRDRLNARLAMPSDMPRLTTFLQSERDRLQANLDAPNPKREDFFWMELSAAQVSRVQPATAEYQKLAVIAWHEGFVNVETQDAPTLRAELAKRNIPLDGPTPDISSRLPALLQDDREWAARLTVLESVYGPALEFQGIGETILRSGAGQKPDLAAFIQNVMQEQVGSVLKDLLNEGPPRPEAVKTERELFAPAIAAAEAEGIRGFRVTRLMMELERNRVTVETRFVAQWDKDRWQTLFIAQETADSSQARPQLEMKLQKDPQVKAVLETIKAVGLLDDAPLQTAMRTGAAAMVTLQAADLAYYAWIHRYTQHVDRPKLLLP